VYREEERAVAATPRPKAERARLVRKDTAAWLLPISERGLGFWRLSSFLAFFKGFEQPIQSLISCLGEEVIFYIYIYIYIHTYVFCVFILFFALKIYLTLIFLLGEKML